MQNVLLFILLMSMNCLDVYENGDKKEFKITLIRNLIFSILFVISYLVAN